MLPNIVVGLMLGAGVAAWVYSKMMRQTGGNAKNSLIVAFVAGGFACVAIMIALASVFHS